MTVMDPFAHFAIVGTVAVDPEVIAGHHQAFDRVLAAHRR